MPQKHGSQLTKAQKSSLRKQTANISLALEDDAAFFGRIMKINMGRCTVNVWDHEKKRHIEVQALLPNRKKAIIKMNDLVNVAKSHPNWEVQVAIDSKTAMELRKKKRISPELANASTADPLAAKAGGDDGFEFDYEGVEQEEEVEVEAPVAAAKKVAVEEDDFDIDDI
jgi:hypothetical protein